MKILATTILSMTLVLIGFVAAQSMDKMMDKSNDMATSKTMQHDDMKKKSDGMMKDDGMHMQKDDMKMKGDDMHMKKDDMMKDDGMGMKKDDMMKKDM